MSLRCLTGVAVLANALASPADSTFDTQAVVKAALQRFQADERKGADYGWTRRSRKTEFNSDGSARSQLDTVVRRERHEGLMVPRLIERNGKPLDASERVRNEGAVSKRVGELKAMTPEQREKVRAAALKKDAEDDAWIAEVPDALDFRPAGEDVVAGRPARVFDVSPRPGYRPSNMKARIFEKLRGKAWIDKADTELAKVDIEIFDTVSVGFGLMARIEKGTRILIERARVDDRVWLLRTERTRVDGRFLLFKSMNQEVVTSYSGYVYQPATR